MPAFALDVGVDDQPKGKKKWQKGKKKASPCPCGFYNLVERDRPGEGNGNPLQYSCLENPMDRGAW